MVRSWSLATQGRLLPPSRTSGTASTMGSWLHLTGFLLPPAPAPHPYRVLHQDLEQCLRECDAGSGDEADGHGRSPLCQGRSRLG